MSGDDDQCEGLVKVEGTHISLDPAYIRETHALPLGDFQHKGGMIEADHVESSFGKAKRYPPGTTGEL